MRTGKQRLERLYNRLRKNFPDKDIRFEDQSQDFIDGRLVRYKVSYWARLFGKDYQICDAIWGDGSYGYKENLLEFYAHTEPEGPITELRAYNLFLKFIKGN
jgi:hypothetical protein